MNTSRVLLCSICFFLSATSFAKTPVKTEKSSLTDEQVIKQVSFEQLQGAINYMLSLVEADPKAKPNKMKCAPAAETAQTWLSGPLHALSDEKLKSEAKLYKQSPATFKKRIAKCLSTCTCNAYQELLDTEDDDVKKSLAYVSDHAFLVKEAKAETTEKSHACATRYKGFCGSVLERYLKAY